MTLFKRYVGIDYSGAKTPTSSLRGLRVFLADQYAGPTEVVPPPSRRKYWTRRGIAEWVLARLKEEQRTIVGIDHGFSFPIDYTPTVAVWMRQKDLEGELGAFLDPALESEERRIANVEGWILGTQ